MQTPQILNCAIGDGTHSIFRGSKTFIWFSRWTPQSARTLKIKKIIVAVSVSKYPKIKTIPPNIPVINFFPIYSWNFGTYLSLVNIINKSLYSVVFNVTIQNYLISCVSKKCNICFRKEKERISSICHRSQTKSQSGWDFFNPSEQTSVGWPYAHKRWWNCCYYEKIIHSGWYQTE